MKRNILRKCAECGKTFWTGDKYAKLCFKCYERESNKRLLKELQERTEARKRAYSAKRAIK